MTHKPAYYMHRALELAEQAQALGEVPVGAVVVSPEGQILGEGFNACIHQHDPSAHAEIQALRNAALALQNYRLTGCSLYVTLEPCTMCIGAMIHARIGQLYYGCKEPKSGAVASVCNLPAQPWYNHQIKVEGGLLKKLCQTQLEAFFQSRRVGS